MKVFRSSILVAVALVGCGVDLELDGETVACRGDAECPAGLSCSVNAGRCVDPKLAEVDAPVLVTATSTDIATVRLTFSEAVDRAAADPGSYTLRPAAIVASAEQTPDLREVILRVDGLVPGFEYNVAATGIADLWGNPLGQPDNATFLGFGAFPDRDPPAIIAPPQDASASGSVRLVWARVALAYSYTVDVSYDEAFTPPLAASFTVLDPQSSVDFTITTSGPHYWRVRANTTNDNAYGHGRFIGLGDTVHVYCPATVSDCSDAGKFGTVTSPLQTVKGGVALARTIGAREVHIAARGGDAVYSDSVTVSGDLRIVGGYTADFDEAARNPRINITTVSTYRDRQLAAFTMLDSSGTTTVEGLRILGWNVNAVIAQGVYNGTIRLVDNELWARGRPGRAVYVRDSRLDSPDHVIIENNHLFQIIPDDFDNPSRGVTAQGVLIEHAAATVRNNRWDMPEECNRTGDACAALRVDRGAVRYTGNTVIIPAVQEIRDGLGVFALWLTESSFELRDNFVHVEGTLVNAVNSALSIENFRPTTYAVVANNVFVSSGVTGTGDSGAASMRTASPTTVANNLFANVTSTADPYALHFHTPTGTVIENNVFVGPASSQHCLDLELVGQSTLPTIAGNVGAVCSEVVASGFNASASVRFATVAELHFAAYPTDVHWTNDTPPAALHAGPFPSTPP